MQVATVWNLLTESLEVVYELLGVVSCWCRLDLPATRLQKQRLSTRLQQYIGHWPELQCEAVWLTPMLKAPKYSMSCSELWPVGRNSNFAAPFCSKTAAMQKQSTCKCAAQAQG